MSDKEHILPLIFTDLDGTLLDHDGYSFAAAQPAINLIKQNAISLIINSSKTASEILLIQQALDIRQPFICENGAAVYLPSDTDAGWLCEALSRPRDHCLQILNQLRNEFGFRFTGFNDRSVEEIMEMTGLPRDNASQAMQRGFTEPIQWLDSAEQWLQFRQQLQARNLSFLQGGRFMCIMAGPAISKGQAMAWLTQRYRDKAQVITIALGDSPNDQAMLNASDIAIVIQSDRAGAVQLDQPKKILRTAERGAQGWQWAIDKLLPLDTRLITGEADG